MRCVCAVDGLASLTSARRQVTLLFTSFTEDELNSAELEDVEARDRARAESRRYNRRFSGEPREVRGTELGETGLLLVENGTAL